jgi:ADP-ribosylglycohydrolase
MPARDPYRGALLGTAVGDAIGLPREGLSARRAERMFGGPPLRHRFLFGRGMISDDTEHACCTAQALLLSGGEPDSFARALAWRLRWWFLCMPSGTGWATLRACLKLWVGFSPDASGVHSAGNGPAMRAPILGVYAAHEPERLRALVRCSTRITHTDPTAEEGAWAVALAAGYGAKRGAEGVRDWQAFLDFLTPQLSHEGLLSMIERMKASLAASDSVSQFATAIGQSKGVSGYILHTVPVALYAWLRHPDDFRAAVEQVIVAGGDADSTGAIVGGLAGATQGVEAIPTEWLESLRDWPRSTAWITTLAEALAQTTPGRPSNAPRVFWPSQFVRNVFFAAVVLTHGFRRLLPPY